MYEQLSLLSDNACEAPENFIKNYVYETLQQKYGLSMNIFNITVVDYSAHCGLSCECGFISERKRIPLPIRMIRMKKNNVFRLEIKWKYIENENVCHLFKKIKHEDWARIDLKIDDLSIIKRMSNVFTSMFEDMQSKDIGCCSRYLECSNAKKCVVSNPNVFLHCYYRSNLLRGKIFYGVNRNV